MKSLLVLGAGLLLAGCAFTPDNPQPVKHFSDVAYGDDARNVMHITRPADKRERPGVLLIHGGGWSRGEPADMDKYVERVVAAGWVAINLSYRLAPDHTWPAQRIDLEQALQTLHARRDEFGLNSSRLAVLGYSAGAHLAAVAALQPNPKTPRPVALVAGAGPFDLTRYPGSRMVNTLMGGIPSVVGKGAYRDASPMFMVTTAAPPTYLWHGTWDTLVGIAQSRDFASELLERGVNVTLNERFGLGHVANFLADGDTWDEIRVFLAAQLDDAPR